MVISFDRPKYFGFVNNPLRFWIVANGTDRADVKVALDEGTFRVVIAIIRANKLRALITTVRNCRALLFSLLLQTSTISKQ